MLICYPLLTFNEIHYKNFILQGIERIYIKMMFHLNDMISQAFQILGIISILLQLGKVMKMDPYVNLVNQNLENHSTPLLEQGRSLKNVTKSFQSSLIFHIIFRINVRGIKSHQMYNLYTNKSVSQLSQIMKYNFPPINCLGEKYFKY